MAAAQERDFYAEAGVLIRDAISATLATAAAGMPHAALVTVAFIKAPGEQPELQPILLLSELSVHTRQLNENSACALLLMGVADGPNPQTAPRLCLSGTAAKTADPAARGAFLARHPYAADYVGFGDFAFWRISVTDSYYIGGFGAARKLAVAKLSTAQ